MLPSSLNAIRDPQKRLTRIFGRLPEAQQATLLEFAEFLASRVADEPRELPKPVPHPRPAEESVVKAIRRLSATYPMLDKAKMLNQTSALVAQHVMQGREARDVIDELEVIFEAHYRSVVAEFTGTDDAETPDSSA